MTAFVLAAIALALATFGYVTRPVWSARPLIGALLVASLALLSGLLYLQVGTPDALNTARLRPPRNAGEAITQLEAALKSHPDEAEGWRLLGRAYTDVGRLADARDALARAAKLAPTADVLTEAAEARAMAGADRRFDAPAVAMLEQALNLQPTHQRARWFLGIAQRQSGRPADAARTWEPLLAQVDARTGASLREQINIARKAAGLAILAAPAGQLKVTVDIAPTLRDRVPAGATLFVFARQPSGPPMPVAAKRLAATFPQTLELGDADSPMTTLRLSQLPRVALVARVSLRGEAVPQAGDFESAARTVDTTSKDTIALTVQRVVE